MKGVIIGTKESGKTTLFNILVSHVTQKFHDSKDLKTQEGEVILEDRNLYSLSSIVNSRKITHPRISLTDFDGFGKFWKEDKIKEITSKLGVFDFIFHVVNGFLKDSEEDFLEIQWRLILSDLDHAEKLLKKKFEYDEMTNKLLEKVHDHLTQEKPLYSLPFSSQEKKKIRGFGFFTLLPYLVFLNTSDLGKQRDFLNKLETMGFQVYPTNLEIEKEILEIGDEKLKKDLRREFNLPLESMNFWIFRELKNTMGLKVFYTVNENEAKAWMIERDKSVIDCAEKIHRDMKEGFIRAEIIKIEDFVKHEGFENVRKMGLIKSVGRDYIPEDEDIIFIRFKS